jgi:hypothetical protein
MKRLTLDERVAAIALALLMAALLCGGLSGCGGGGGEQQACPVFTPADTAQYGLIPSPAGGPCEALGSGPPRTVQPPQCAASAACV